MYRQTIKILIYTPTILSSVTKYTQIQLDFPVYHQYWMDSGLLGFYSLAKSAQENYAGVILSADDSGVHLEGTEENLQKFLEDVYQTLLNDYYNTSSPKQIEENAGFYYDSQKDEFVRFPKVQSMGIASIIYSKALSPTASSVAYLKEKDGATRKNQLPVEYAHLQERFDDFLSTNSLKAEGATFLIDGRNAYQPKVTIAVSPKKRQNAKPCYLCGCDSRPTAEVSGTVFPLITSSEGIMSFNSGCKSPFSVCNQCEYISKFVPVTGYYSQNDTDYYVFLPYSHSFSKMLEVYQILEAAKKYDASRYRNYEELLGGYFQKPFEQFFSFLYTVYQRTCTTGSSDEEEGEMDFEELCNINLSKAPLSYYVLHFHSLGKTLAGKLVWNFTEAVYIFRLFSKLNECGIRIRDVMLNLIDRTQTKNENKTLVRNRVCERILTKQPVADLIYQFVYHVSRSEQRYIKPLAEFAETYEKLLYEDDIMKQELINSAVSLGKTIGLTVGEQGKKGKGDLFRLKKARKTSDFLNEISRIQMKYGVSVTKSVYESGELLDENFAEFKQFCMIAALNSFNAKTSDKAPKGE